MPSFQDTAPGAKSSKMKGMNIFTPFLAQPGDLDGDDEQYEPILSEQLDNRLRIQQPRQPIQAPMAVPPQQQMQQPVPQPPPVPQPEEAEIIHKNEKKTTDDEDDSDFDSEFEDDDAALDAFRQRRLAELKKEHQTEVENKAKGHGEVRTISQDEFLPECTGSSKYVAVHFFHDDFERCKIMDHHLKRMAALHLTCKFLRINAEKAPFFATKLGVKTLPTVIVFQDGKSKDRLIGFDGLTTSKNHDQFTTSSLGRWLERTGAIEYEGPDSDEEEEGVGRSRTGMLQGRFSSYDADL